MARKVKNKSFSRRFSHKSQLNQSAWAYNLNPLFHLKGLSPRLPMFRGVRRTNEVAPKPYYSPYNTKYLHNKGPVKVERLGNRSLLNKSVLLEKICYNRKVRKQVIHAKGVAGSKVAPPRYTEKSKVRCK